MYHINFNGTSEKQFEDTMYDNSLSQDGELFSSRPTLHGAHL